jgi:hypothetical protein
MQQQTRYYITKSGEESTVRSVRVARSVVEPIAIPETDVSNQSDHSGTSNERTPREPGLTVKGRLRGAIKKRVLAQ